MSKTLKNKDLKDLYSDRQFPVMYHKEPSIGGHVAVFLAQDVKLKQLVEEGSSFALAAFLGSAGNSQRECLRAITVVPENHAVAQLPVGSKIKNATIKIWRNTNPFRDDASEKAKYPSQVVLNARTGLIATRDNLPIFEHRMVVLADPEKEYVNDLTVPGTIGTVTSQEVKLYLETEYDVPSDRAAKAAQIDFVLPVIEDEMEKETAQK